VKTYSSNKEALLAAGRIKAITRGRISRENHEWLEKEISAKRISITGATVVKSETAKGEKRVSVKAVNGSTEKHIADFTILYPKNDYHAIGNDGKTYGMAEVCNNCRVSLVQNQCEDPMILGNVRVQIVRNA